MSSISQLVDNLEIKVRSNSFHRVLSTSWLHYHEYTLSTASRSHYNLSRACKQELLHCTGEMQACCWGKVWIFIWISGLGTHHWRGFHRKHSKSLAKRAWCQHSALLMGGASAFPMVAKGKQKGSRHPVAVLWVCLTSATFSAPKILLLLGNSLLQVFCNPWSLCLIRLSRRVENPQPVRQCYLWFTACLDVYSKESCCAKPDPQL